MTKLWKLPKPEDNKEPSKEKSLPFDGSVLTSKHFSFSFACFDRSHKLFNLGSNTSDGVVSGKWFLDLLDCLKSASNLEIPTLETSMHDLHRIDWSKTNTSAPPNSDQLEYWQFRINKSKGRIIGFKIENLFYVVWLDPHHNLTDSEGYGTATKYYTPKSEYETLQDKIQQQTETIFRLEQDLQATDDLLNELNKSKPPV